MGLTGVKMLQRCILASALVLSALSPSAAWAGFENTKWGDDFSAVRTAVRADAKQYPDSEVAFNSPQTGAHCRLHVPNASLAGYQFRELKYCFDDAGKLSLVILESDGKSFYELDRALRSQFGQPVQEASGPIATRSWNDEAKDNSIRLLLVTDAMLIYAPREKGF
jgi:hypothetical protein